MWKRILVGAACLILIAPTGCLNKKKISGKEFIPREDFVNILVDLHLVDGVTQDRKFYRRYEQVDSIDLLGPILDKYGVTRHMFDTTIYEYSRHPELFDQVYSDVLIKLNVMLEQVDNEPAAEGREAEPEDGHIPVQ